MGDGSVGFDEPDGGSDAWEDDEFDGFAEGVSPWEERERAVGFVDGEAGGGAACVDDDVFVGQFDAARHTGRAARVDDIGEVVLGEIGVDIVEFFGFFDNF